MLTPVNEVLRTLTTSGHQSLMQWGDLVVPYQSRSAARPVTDPLPTLTTVDPAAVTSLAVDPMDCLFRMLEPREIANGMAFPSTTSSSATAAPRFDKPETPSLHPLRATSSARWPNPSADGS